MNTSTIFKIAISILLVAIFFLTGISMFGGLKYGDDVGLFNIIGKQGVYTDFKEIDSDNDNILSDVMDTDVPEVKGSNVIVTIGQVYNIKDFIMVKPVGSNDFIDGSLEEGFNIIIDDIKDFDGESILGVSLDEGEATDDILSSAYYDVNDCTIQFNSNGVYRVYFKVYGLNGRYIISEMNIPVEA